MPPFVTEVVPRKSRAVDPIRSPHTRAESLLKPAQNSDLRKGGQFQVTYSHRPTLKLLAALHSTLGAPPRYDYDGDSCSKTGGSIVSKKIAVVAVLCAVVALVACRREEYRPLKLGGPVAEQPAR